MDIKPEGVLPNVDIEDDFEEFCRLCFDKSDNHIMKQVFPNDIPDRDLLWKILECTTLKLTFDYDSSARICHTCIQKINEFCDYRMQCLRNDKQIKTRRHRKRTFLQINSFSDEQWAQKQHPENTGIIEQDDPLDNYDSFCNDTSDDVEDDDAQQSAVTAKPPHSADENRPFQCDMISRMDESDQPDTSVDADNLDRLQPKKKRTRKVLLYEGHTYQLLSSRPKSDSITWGCLWRRSKECKGTIGTKANGQILGNVIPQHNHAPEVFENKKPKAVIIHAFREVENIYLSEPYEIVKNRIGGDVLLCGGNRYPYSHSRKDGCRIWKCSSHRNCTVSMYLCPDGRIFTQANSRHAEEKIQQKRSRILDNEHSLSDLSANIEELYPNPVGTFNYKIVKNTNKRNVLIYEGDRYSFYYRKTNGWVVWRCTVSKACHAMIYQLSDESVVVLGETTHNHLKINDTQM